MDKYINYRGGSMRIKAVYIFSFVVFVFMALVLSYAEDQDNQNYHSPKKVALRMIQYNQKYPSLTGLKIIGKSNEDLVIDMNVIYLSSNTVGIKRVTY